MKPADVVKKFAANLRLYPDVKNLLRAKPPTLEESIRVVKEQLANREQNFISKVRIGVFANERSPYRNLFAEARIDLPKLESLVKHAGVEGALEELRTKDVYIKYEEFKSLNAGRSEYAEKFGKDTNFNNPLSRLGMTLRSSGSRSAGTRVFMDLSHVRAGSQHRVIRQAMFGINQAETVRYFPILPDAGGVRGMIMDNFNGNTISAWFCPIDPKRAPLFYRMATSYALAVLRLAGGQVVKPQYVPLSDVRPIARFIAERKKHGARSAFRGYATTGVRVCAAAEQEGLDLSGTYFSMTGEPVTQAKYDKIRAAGAVPIVSYASVDAGQIGAACPHGQGPDDLHLLTNRLALIRHKRRLPEFGMEVNPFLVTSLMPTAPLVLINVETDDYGELSERPCDCILGQLGLTRRVSKVRSFVKLTTEGMTFVGTDLIDVIESELPSKFGGGPLDYQLLEQEDAGGITSMSLRVSPDVGAVDEKAIVELLYASVRASGGGGPLFSEIWREGNSIRVVREKPFATRAGKVFAFHTLR